MIMTVDNPKPGSCRFILFVRATAVTIFLTAFALVIGFSCNSIFPTQTKPDVPKDHTLVKSGVLHKPGLRAPLDPDQGCFCHGSDLRGNVAMSNDRMVVTPSCTQCHGALWEKGGNGEND